MELDCFSSYFGFLQARSLQSMYIECLLQLKSANIKNLALLRQRIGVNISDTKSPILTIRLWLFSAFHGSFNNTLSKKIRTSNNQGVKTV